MNYINRLELDNFDIKAKLAAAKQEIEEFRSHLNLPKFQGVESDGGRKDWIATGDVLSYLSNIEGTLV